MDDVLCCARSILHGGERDTTPGRPEPDVAVELGEPVQEPDGLRVPIRVLAADRVGAARLALALPLDRYDVTGVETGAGAGGWLELHEAVDGRLVLGLIGLDADRPAGESTTLDLALRLALKPGQSAGGEVGIADLQLSGRDGVTLVVTALPVAVPLPVPESLALSAARPNPFTHETRFTLNLERAADVELAVHDLGGRRVATLHRGPLGAGPHVVHLARPARRRLGRGERRLLPAGARGRGAAGPQADPAARELSEPGVRTGRGATRVPRPVRVRRV